MERLGFIGLGLQGAPMAERFIAAGFPTTLYARRAETLEPFRTSGAAFAATPRELGQGSDIVGICVVNSAQVEEVLSGENGLLAGMAPGGVVLLHSTVPPEDCQRFAALAAACGIELVDAPVSGGAAGARAGKLLVMVGGKAEVFERCQPVFATYGKVIRHLGPLGSGQKAKLVNNLLFYANLALVHDAFALAQGLGISPLALEELLRHGSSRSFALETYLQGGRIHYPEAQAVFTQVAGALCAKDVDIALDLAACQGASAGELGEAGLRAKALFRVDE